MSSIVITGIAIGGLAFGIEMVCDQRLKTGRRVIVASCFALAGFFVGVGVVACFLFHDGILPDDVRLSGWSATFSFAKAFLRGPALVAAPLAIVALTLRRFPRMGVQTISRS